MQLTSNVTNYTVLLELYNFSNNGHRLHAIGVTLRAIFSLKVSCFTGCNKKSDYTSLRRQYQQFELPEDSTYGKMDDVSIMAVNRGVTMRGQNKTTLETLCKIEGYFLKKTSNVRVGTCFASKAGSLSKEAQQYCQLDVEAPLLLHEVYSSLPDLTLQMTQKTVTIGSIVDIMPESGKSMKLIA